MFGHVRAKTASTARIKFGARMMHAAPRWEGLRPVSRRPSRPQPRSSRLARCLAEKRGTRLQRIGTCSHSAARGQGAAQQHALGRDDPSY